jgi:hypothetical protein
MNIYFPESSSMSEWTEWHLTTRGWERGFQMRESSEKITETEVPIDRVLTCRYHENVTINSTWMQKHITEIWQDSNLKIVEQMLEKFGTCPECL